MFLSNGIIQAGLFDDAPPLAKVKSAVVNLLKEDVLQKYVSNEAGFYLRSLHGIVSKQLSNEKHSKLEAIAAPKDSLDYFKAEADIYRKHQTYIIKLNQKFNSWFTKYDTKIKQSINQKGKTGAQRNGRSQSVLAHLNNARKEYENFWNNFSTGLWP